MIWLSKDQIIYLHQQLIKESGGIDGLRDENLLSSSLLSPLQTEFFPNNY